RAETIRRRRYAAGRAEKEYACRNGQLPQTMAGTGAVHYCMLLCAVDIAVLFPHGAVCQSVGHDLKVSALVTSCAMVGNIIGKVVLGAIADKWNIWRTSRLAMGIVGTAYILLIAGGEEINLY